ncbi:CotH kinase family protein [Hymenobacter sp. CRA2]|uniref:CotH kinase family protein n=1 Tax=Hymenobacter sp. CRA2 TaxID=1955620 RepID=UPI00159246B0|nr:CotH kinase family protein [Hymenobacter sp. CRA2]
MTVAPRFYHVDRANKIIVINQSITALNGNPDRKGHLALDSVYTFAQPVTTLRTDSSYQVRSGNAAYKLFFTQLPVAHIDTRYTIMDAPSVYAQFQLVEASGQQVQSNLGVEFRGGYSQNFPKKSYELSFWNDTVGTASRDVTLLGMRTDNKYNLQALYNEPLRFRSKVSNALWQEIHQIYYKNLEPDAKNGIAMEYVELFVNGEYRGIYALSERVDRKQLKLKKYNNGILGELYKGSDWGGAVTFTGLPPVDNNSETWGGFEYKHPEEQIDWTNLYTFVSFVQNSTEADFMTNYKQQFHLGNAVDYYLFLNLLRATDNTGKNIYIAKYKRNEPYYYVPWDLDGVFGTDYTGGNTGNVDDILTNGMYSRLTRDCSAGGFREALQTRWNALRASVITEQHIMAKFRAEYDYLNANNAYAREQLAWGDYQHDTTQLAYMTGWLRHRLTYLDNAFNQSCAAVTSVKTQTDGLLKLYPNPANDYLMVETGAAGTCQLSIRDLSGRLVQQTTLTGKQNRLDIGQLRKGVYVVTLKTATAVATEKLVIN